MRLRAASSAPPGRRLGRRAHVGGQSNPESANVVLSHRRSHARGHPPGGHAGLGEMLRVCAASSTCSSIQRCGRASANGNAPPVQPSDREAASERGTLSAQTEVEPPMPIDVTRGKSADIRRGKLTESPRARSELRPGHLAVLPKEQAYDFLLFCQRNPRPCPIEVTTSAAEPVWRPGRIQTDIPRYRTTSDGVLADEVTDATPYWRDDLVVFLPGCSFTRVGAARGRHQALHVDHGERRDGEDAPMPARGVFHGPMVVSMRPIPRRSSRRRGDGERPVAPTVPRCTSAILPPSASRTSRAPTGATRRYSPAATCRYSGRAASRLRPSRSRRGRRS